MAKVPMGQRLLGWRRAAGLTQKGAADRLGVSQPAWLDWERGTRRPSRERAAAIETLTGGLLPAGEWFEADGRAA